MLKWVFFDDTGDIIYCKSWGPMEKKDADNYEDDKNRKNNNNNNNNNNNKWMLISRTAVRI